MSQRQPLQSATTSPTATGTMNVTNVVKVAPFSSKVLCAAFKWWSCEFFYTSSHFCVAHPADHLSVKQSISQYGGSLCIAFPAGAVVVSVGQYRATLFFLTAWVFQCSQIFRNGWNHSVNNIPWNPNCAYCPVSPSCEPGSPAGHTLLCVVCHSDSSVYSKQTTVAVAGNIKCITYWAFSWEKCMLLSKLMNLWGCFVEYAI